MTNRELIEFLRAASPRLRDAWDHLAQRPWDAVAQLQFARELERHPEALTAWRRYHEERPSRRHREVSRAA
jgi:hypothetical protein